MTIVWCATRREGTSPLFSGRDQDTVLVVLGPRVCAECVRDNFTTTTKKTAKTSWDSRADEMRMGKTCARTVNRQQKREVGVHVHGEGREGPTRPDQRTLVHNAALASSQVPVMRSITKASFFGTANMRPPIESSCTLISSRTAPTDRRKGPASLGADRTSTIDLHEILL